MGQHVEYNKGLVLEALDQKDAALKSFDLVKSVNFDPLVTQDAYLKKIGILNDQKKFTAALTEIDECNKRFPKGKNLNDLLKLRIFTVSNWGNLGAIEAYLKQAKGQNTDVQAIYQSLLYDKANRAYKSNDLTLGYNLSLVNEFRRNTYNDEVKISLSKYNLKKNNNFTK